MAIKHSDVKTIFWPVMFCSVTYWHTQCQQSEQTLSLSWHWASISKNIVQHDGNESFTEDTREKSSECAAMHWEEMTQKKMLNNIDLPLVHCKRFTYERNGKTKQQCENYNFLLLFCSMHNNIWISKQRAVKSTF